MIEIKFDITPAGKRVIERHAKRAEKIVKLLGRALDQGLHEIESHLQSEYLRGGSPGVKRGGNAPHAVRSGALIQSTRTVMDGELTGFVGVGAGLASKYARAIVGKGTTTITPKKARHLWIPIADNLTPSGVARKTPSEVLAMTTPNGRRLAQIFTSKQGNKVVFLPEAHAASDLSTRRQGFARTGARYARGRNKGRRRGRLMFVLKDYVEIEGSDSLARATEERAARVHDLLFAAAVEALA